MRLSDALIDLRRTLLHADEGERERILKSLDETTLYFAFSLSWIWQARDKQLPCPEKPIWMVQTGRGWGKTRSAASAINFWVACGEAKVIHLVGATAADVRDIMITGGSGILGTALPDCRPIHKPSKRRIEWPNGAYALTFSAEEPNRLRGPECDTFWADEAGSWNYGVEAWDNLELGWRIGSNRRGIISTTPRPTPLIKALRKRKDIRIVYGHTNENRGNLSEGFVEQLEERFGGTRVGRQELCGDYLEDNPAALWKREWIERDRLRDKEWKDLDLAYLCVAIDPSTTPMGDPCGLIVLGGDTEGHVYVLHDATAQGSPDSWVRKAIALHGEYQADAIVYEGNQGGYMTRDLIRNYDTTIKTMKVTARRGKYIRAEEPAMMSEQGKMHMVGEYLELEDELCNWSPDLKGADSPNRMDALVLGVWYIRTIRGRRKQRMKVFG